MRGGGGEGALKAEVLNLLAQCGKSMKAGIGPPPDK